MSLVFHYKRQIITFIASVALSLILVTTMAFGATYFAATSIGIGTDTPGAALGAKGAGIFEGFVSANNFTATSTEDSWILGGLGIGTTTVSEDLNKDGGLAVAGGAIIGEGLTVSYIKATSTVASSFGGNLGVGTTSPSTALGIKGAGVFEGFVSANNFTATSTEDSWILGGLGIGTTTVSEDLNKDGGLAVAGGAIIGEGLTVSYVKATSTVASSFGGNLGAATTSPSVALSVIGSLLVNNTASSTFLGGIHVKDVGGLTTNSGLTVTGGDIASAGKLIVTSAATSSITGGVTIDTTTLVVNAGGNSVGIATSTMSYDPDLILAIGAGSASTTVFIAGGDSVGSGIIFKDTDGNGCTMISFNNGEMQTGDVPCPTSN